MNSIELNKTTVNELLHNVRDLFNMDGYVSSSDTVTLVAYYKHALESHKIGEFCIYNDSNNVGEFVSESTIKQYDLNLHTYRDGSRSLEVKVVINQ